MIEVKHLGTQPYEVIWEEMKKFTAERQEHTPDELWLVEHPSIYTQGQAGKPEHILNPQSIPVLQTDRGGQVTYHGPGQLVAYLLINIKNRHLGIRTLVTQLENLLISVLAHFKINAMSRCDAPGVYVDDKKIASIGLRVKNGCTYHGIALNVNMDLTPFSGINPCGFAQMEMTQVADYCPEITVSQVSTLFTSCFLTQFES